MNSILSCRKRPHRGRLDLEDKLGKYFPELPYPEVDIRDLLNMTSKLSMFLLTVIDHGDTHLQ